MTLTVEMAVPPRAKGAAEAAAAAAAGRRRKRRMARLETKATRRRPRWRRGIRVSNERRTLPSRGTETTSVVVLSCARRARFPCDGGGVSFLRAVIAATRAQNAKALRADAAVADAAAEDDARLRFRLANAEVSEARASDPDDPCFHLVTGYHLVDGAARQITVEGTPEAVAPIAALFAARAPRRTPRRATRRRIGKERILETDPGA